jgi:hypothetical protein
MGVCSSYLPLDRAEPRYHTSIVSRFQLQIIALLRVGCAKMPIMARKPKKKTFSAAKVVREMARERVGSPKPSRLVAAKNTKPERHKPTLGELLTDE